MEATANLATVVAWWGGVLGFIIGAVGYRSNFCTMGAVSDVVNMGDWNRMRMWLLAIAVAVIGANSLQLLGYIDLSKSIYQTPNFTWFNYIGGGFLFGVGMSLASGCGTKTLIRIGGGNLKSVVVFLVLGIVAYMTMRGVFGVFRVTYLEPIRVTFDSGQDLPSLASSLTGADKRTVQILLTAIVGGGSLLFVLLKREFWTFDNLLGGIAIGLAIVGGWYVTGHLGYAENPDTLEMKFFGTNTGLAESITNVAPFAYTLELLMLWSDTSLRVTFSVAAVIGIVLGAFAYAVSTRQFRVEGFCSAGDTANHMLGGALMGFGGVLAMGCTFGQGITGFSTLALGSVITFFSIVAGAAATMKYQYWKMMQGANAAAL